MLNTAFNHNQKAIMLWSLVAFAFNCASLSAFPIIASEPLAIINTALFSTAAPTSPLKHILVKPSKVLTVGLEYFSENSSLSEDELSILSMQLRQSKASTIWCKTITDVAAIAAEQRTAAGNFPGPVSVIYNPDYDTDLDALAVEVQKAMQAGAVAVALEAPCADCLGLGDDIPIIWKITDPGVVPPLGDAYLVEADDLEQLSPAIPDGAVRIVAIQSMQLGGAEIPSGRALCKAYGCQSILAQGACVGDGEDAEYARYFCDGITSKKSAEFRFSGLTGSTNGHFGGVEGTATTKWRRMERPIKHG